METKTSFTIIRTRVGRPCNFSSAAHRAGRASRSMGCPMRSLLQESRSLSPVDRSMDRDTVNDREDCWPRGTCGLDQVIASADARNAPKQQAQLVLAASALFDSP